MYFKEVFKLQQLPDAIVSDMRPQLASDLWKHICKRLGVKGKLSEAFNSQRDGQSNRMNAVIEQYQSPCVNHQQNDWVHWYQWQSVQLIIIGQKQLAAIPSVAITVFTQGTRFIDILIRIPPMYGKSTHNRKQLFNEVQADMKQAHTVHTEEANRS